MGAGGGGTVDVEDVLDEDDPPIYNSYIATSWVGLVWRYKWRYAFKYKFKNEERMLKENNWKAPDPNTGAFPIKYFNTSALKFW